MIPVTLSQRKMISESDSHNATIAGLFREEECLFSCLEKSTADPLSYGCFDCGTSGIFRRRIIKEELSEKPRNLNSSSTPSHLLPKIFSLTLSPNAEMISDRSSDFRFGGPYGFEVGFQCPFHAIFEKHGFQWLIMARGQFNS